MNYPEWCRDANKVNELASHLNELGHFRHIRDVLNFFEKPYKWNLEWEKYIAECEVDK